MENNGEGQLTMGPLEIKEWTIIPDQNGFAMKEDAESCIRLLNLSVNQSTYGLTGQKPKNVEFTTTEMQGRFYIWYRQVEESSEKQTL